MIVSDILPALEQAAAVLADLDATSVEIRGAAESARASVREADKALAGHEASETEIFTAIAPPAPRAGAYRLRARSMRETVDALLAHDRGGQILAAQRKIAVWLGAELDTRAEQVKQAEATRDEARKPFREQTRRARELAEKISAVFAPNSALVMKLFCDDVVICRLAGAAYSYLPRSGTHVGSYAIWTVPPCLATDNILAATKLPGHWPPGWNGRSPLAGPFDKEDDDEIVRPLRTLTQKGPESAEEVDRALAIAQSLLLRKYLTAVDAIEEVLDLDAAVSVEDRKLKYPDGEFIFADSNFPDFWRVGRMRSVVKLSRAGLAQVAE